MAMEDDLFASFMNEIETVEKETKDTRSAELQIAGFGPVAATAKSQTADDGLGIKSLASQIMGGDDDDADELYLAERAERRAAEFASIPEVHVTTTVALLPAVNHNSIEYEDFEREFYRPHPALAKLAAPEVAQRRKALQVTVTGAAVPAPLASFMQAGFTDAVLGAIAKAGYSTPTPIQAQAVPVLMSGRDTLGLAETGSGKTLAYGWPLLTHCLAQREIQNGEGPIALVLAPTRELVIQVYKSIKKFAKVSGMSVCPVYGGVSKWEQTKELRKGHEVLVATPGRLIDLIKSKSTNLRRVTLCVLDEADTMLDLGFEAQVRSILAGIRPDRQTVLFTATLKRKLQSLVTQALHRPVTITAGLQVAAGGGSGGGVRPTMGRAGIGAPGSAGSSGQGTRMVRSAEHIRQHVRVLTDDAAKWPWLHTYLPHMAQCGKVLLFVASKAAADQLALQAQAALAHLPQFAPAPLPGAGAGRSHSIGAFHSGQHVVAALHGDKLQGEREAVVAAFKRCSTGPWERPPGPLPVRVLVATDIASRGMDIPGVAFVVHVDAPKSMDIHTQRSGRTGRMAAGGDAGVGEHRPGIVVTLLNQTQTWFAAELLRHLEACGWAVGGGGQASGPSPVAATAVDAATEVAGWAGPPLTTIPPPLVYVAMGNSHFRAGRTRNGHRRAASEASALASTQAFLASLAGGGSRGGGSGGQPPPLPPPLGAQTKDGSFSAQSAHQGSKAEAGGLGYASVVAGGTAAVAAASRKRSRFGAPMATLDRQAAGEQEDGGGVFAHRRSLVAGMKMAAAAKLRASFVKADTAQQLEPSQGGLAAPLTSQELNQARSHRLRGAEPAAVPNNAPVADSMQATHPPPLGLPPPPPADVPPGAAPTPKRSRWAPAGTSNNVDPTGAAASAASHAVPPPAAAAPAGMTPAQAAAAAAAVLKQTAAPMLTPAATAQLAAARALGHEDAIGEFGGGAFYVKGMRY